MKVVLSLDQQLAGCLTFEAYRFAGEVGLIGKPSRGSELAQLEALMLGTGAQRQKPLKRRTRCKAFGVKPDVCLIRRRICRSDIAAGLGPTHRCGRTRRKTPRRFRRYRIHHRSLRKTREDRLSQQHDHLAGGARRFKASVASDS